MPIVNVCWHFTDDCTYYNHIDERSSAISAAQNQPDPFHLAHIPSHIPPDIECSAHRALLDETLQSHEHQNMDLYLCGHLLKSTEKALTETYDAMVILSRGHPVNTTHFSNISTTLDQRRRRWADVV